MDALRGMLAAEDPIRPDTVIAWNKGASDLVLEMLKRVEPPPPTWVPAPEPPVVAVPTPNPAAVDAVTLIQDRSVSIDDDDLAAFARELVAELKGHEGRLGRRLLVSVTVRPAPDTPAKAT